jgi:hypothetical protein
MANLEPLKNLNTLLEQVVNLAEKDPSLLKVLELAGQVAKYWRPASRERSFASYAPVETEVDQSTGDPGTVNTLDKIQTLNSTVKSVTDTLEIANQLAKQMSKIGPLFTSMLKNLPPVLPGQKWRHHKKSYSTGIEALDNQAITSALITLLIPVLIINLVKKNGF